MKTNKRTSTCMIMKSTIYRVFYLITVVYNFYFTHNEFVFI